jgi:hypothetical protein
MKAKLIKTGEQYLLKDPNNETVAITAGSIKGRMLSLKNCQAIERGYDLDELFNDYYKEWSPYSDIIDFNVFEAGFQKALEILGDKKFSEEDIAKAYNKGQILNIKGRLQTGKNYVKSLQQTEWDVIVEPKKVIDETKIVGSVKGVKGSGNKITTYKSVPKLDANGCLILKRV